jgi:putative tryptophan/tyrosine transport system substrate-binding protein
MRRREFIAGLAGAAAWPLAARAQQGDRVRRIGMLMPGDENNPVWKPQLSASFLQGLKETGYVEGQNVAVEYRWAENQIDRLPALPADLVRRRVTVIVANGGLAMLAAKAATPTIPIVFLTGSDPCIGSCRQPQPARREPHRYYPFISRAGPETIAIAPRVDPQCCPVRRSR